MSPTSCAADSLAPLRTTIQGQSPAIAATLRRVIGARGRLPSVNPVVERVLMIMENRVVALTCTFGLVSRVSQASSKVPIARREFELPKVPVTPVTATLSDGRDLRNSDTMGRQR